MRSSEGLYFSRLDHVRAGAAYLVFVFHFIHPDFSLPFSVPYSSLPPFPFSLIEEGHTGVALFMTLSGYLFCKIVGDREIRYGNFLWNRAVRLGPLLILCLAAWTMVGWLIGSPVPLRRLIEGFIKPVWPGAAWSVAVELHFYLLFPVLLLAMRRFGPNILVVALLLSIAAKTGIWLSRGSDVQYYAYFTIIGRFDQFVLGMLFARLSISGPVRAGIAALSGAGFLLLWHLFNEMRIFYLGAVGAGFSPTPISIIIPSIEGLAYASFIAWYDRANLAIPIGLDRVLGKVGSWSYSIYLLHFFLGMSMGYLLAGHVAVGANFWLAWMFASLCFVAFLPVAALSYRWIETPFLSLRGPYARSRAPAVNYGRVETTWPRAEGKPPGIPRVS